MAGLPYTDPAPSNGQQTLAVAQGLGMVPQGTTPPVQGPTTTPVSPSSVVATPMTPAPNALQAALRTPMTADDVGNFLVGPGTMRTMANVAPNIAAGNIPAAVGAAGAGAVMGGIHALGTIVGAVPYALHEGAGYIAGGLAHAAGSAVMGALGQTPGPQAPQASVGAFGVTPAAGAVPADVAAAAAHAASPAALHNAAYVIPAGDTRPMPDHTVLADGSVSYAPTAGAVQTGGLTPLHATITNGRTDAVAGGGLPGAVAAAPVEEQNPVEKHIGIPAGSLAQTIRDAAPNARPALIAQYAGLSAQISAAQGKQLLNAKIQADYKGSQTRQQGQSDADFAAQQKAGADAYFTRLAVANTPASVLPGLSVGAFAGQQ